MGSFSEVVMSFDFREDTPAEVLASVSALERPLEEGAYWGPAPELPPPVVEPGDFWVPDWREEGTPDEFEHEPWRHDWAPWLSGNMMAVGTVPSASLVWTETQRWNLTFRCAFKSWAGSIFTFLEWLGPFVDTWGLDRPLFLGYIDDEGEPRPYLLWAHEGRLTMEDLNGGPGAVG